MASAVDTSRVKERRTLRFQSIDDAFAEIDRIEQADRVGKLRTLGNWTAGQILAHISSWIEYGYDGYPLGPPPFFIRWILKFAKKKYLRNGMPAGVHIPKVENGTFGMDLISTAEGIDRVRRAFKRLKVGEPAIHHSPAFGEMPHDERIQLNLRHAELHLGFLTY